MSPRRARITHKLVSRIGDQRGSGVRYQNDDLTIHARNQSRARAFVAVIVIGGHRHTYTQMSKQLCGHARVFGGDQIGGSQRCGPPSADVAKVADGRRDDIETRQGRF